MKMVPRLLFLLVLFTLGSGKKAHSNWDKKLVSPKSEADNDDIYKMLSEDEEYEDLNVEEDEPADISPCENVHCGPGRSCSEVGDEAVCGCVQECHKETDVRRHVCSNHNVTFTSDCSLYQARCWCEEGDERCRNTQLRHVHVEYYGECRHGADCRHEEMVDFPRRMREWMFSVMQELADREEISDHYIRMEREAEVDISRRWSNAAIWQWCQLDLHPRDSLVSRHELFPLRAPLHSLEHCVSPFLDSCDANQDHDISLQEWAECLQLEPEKLAARCEIVQ